MKAPRRYGFGRLPGKPTPPAAMDKPEDRDSRPLVTDNVTRRAFRSCLFPGFNPARVLLVFVFYTS